MSEANPPSQPLTPERAALLAEKIPSLVRFGTSSWNYPGWAGLVYHRKYPKSGAAARRLEEYASFPLFRTVGMDSSFYAPPEPAQLQRYNDALPAGFPCVSKVWERITVHTHSGHRGSGPAGELNPDFLNPALFLDEVAEPWQKYFSDHQGPFVFEFQTIARRAGLAPQEFADRLDRFFSALPRALPYAVEVRNEEFLCPPYFAVLREHGVAHVLNSWTRMPPIGDQLAIPESITGSWIIVRALLRPGRTYQQAVDRFAPYDRIREPNPYLRRDLVRVIHRAQELRIPAYVLVNNRTEGSAPHTIAAVAEMLEDAEGRVSSEA